MSRLRAPASSCLRFPSSSSLRFCAFCAVSTATFFRNHDHTIVVRNHDITRLNVDAGANHRDIDRTKRGFHRAFGRNGLRPDRKAHFRDRPDVAAAGINNKSGDATRTQCCREQFSEHSVGIVRRAADNQDIAFLALLDRDVDHPVVTWLCQHGDRRARNLCPGPDRPHTGFIKPDRPRASCAVETPTAPSVPIALLSARSMLRTTMGFISRSPQRSGTVADMPRHRSSERRCYGCPGCPG